MTNEKFIRCLKRTSEYASNNGWRTESYEDDSIDRLLECVYKKSNYYKDSKEGCWDTKYRYNSASNKSNEPSKKALNSYKNMVKETATILSIIIALNLGYNAIIRPINATFNRIVNSIDEATSSLNISVLSDCDNKVVTGEQVLEANNYFKDRSYAIIVKSNISNRAENEMKSKYFTPLGINYNALVSMNNISLTEDNKYQCTELEFKKEQDVTQYNANDEANFAIEKVVNEYSKYGAKLLEDETNTVVGIVFEQQ